jgi:hypothetical protein
MSNYCKKKYPPVNYYECRAYVEDGDNPLIIWRLRQLLGEKSFNITPQMFADHYEPCSPGEALGTMF